MAHRQTDPLKELKEIAKIRVDKERHRLAAMRDEANRLETEQNAVRKQISDLTKSTDASPEAFINMHAYLNALSDKVKRLADEQHEAAARTEAQKEKIKTALASQIRVDGMDED